MDTKNIITNSLSNKINLIIPLCIITVFSTLFMALIPLFVGNLVSSVVNGKNFTLWCALSCSLVPLRLICEYIKSNQVFALGNYITSSLQKEAYKSCMRAEAGELKKIDYKDLSARISSDCRKIGYDYISKNVVEFITNVTYLAIIFITMMCIAPTLGLIVICGIPVFYLSIIGVRKLYKKNSLELSEKQVEGNKVIEENFYKILDIKVKNGVNKEIEDYNTWFDNNCKKQYFNWTLRKLNDGFVYDIVVSLISIITIAVGLSLALANESAGVSLGNVISYVFYVPTIFSAVLPIMNNRIRFSAVEAEVNRLDEVFQFKSEVKAEPITTLDEIFSIRFSDVNYINEKITVSNLSLELKNNEKLGILCLDDLSGDTIYDLLTKIKRPRSGSITYNNCEVTKINTFYLRDIITAVSNHSDLFDDTIMNNITYPLAFDEYKYNDSLYKAKLKDVIFELEGKDNTMISDLSEEARQQVILANAFYKDSKVFVFNNATDKLNINLEDEIVKEITKLKNKLVIMISNRSYDLVNCDKVLVISEGKTLEYGSVEELINNKNSVFSASMRKIKLAKTKVS